MHNPAVGNASVWRRLGDLILTRDFRQRRCVTMVLTTAILYAACLALYAYGIVFGIIDAAAIKLSSTLIALTPIMFYAVVRSGMNLRFAEPTLALPQALVAQSLLAMSYSSLAPIYPGTLVLLAMVMCFGMFDMATRNVRLVLFYTIGVMGLAMAWSAWTDPLAYPPPVQLFYFAVMCTALPAISSLSVQLSTMRDRLKSQRGELETALAQIQLVATHDELTKLPNRRHMITLLGEHITRHGAAGRGFPWRWPISTTSSASTTATGTGSATRRW